MATAVAVLAYLMAKLIEQRQRRAGPLPLDCRLCRYTSCVNSISGSVTRLG